MVKSIFDELAKPEPKNDFTIGIYDDVSHKSLDYDSNYRVSVVKGSMSAVFYGLGSDGTVYLMIQILLWTGIQEIIRKQMFSHH